MMDLYRISFSFPLSSLFYILQYYLRVKSVWYE
uniref:Uncharacterized protein n=1 Tax=Anguilla anguilla TaxID=7936 RepID=A0A0E9VT28_ANGAN